MNVSKELVDSLNAVVTVKVVSEDYEPKVQEVLKSYRRNAKIDGFRPGKAPEGIIRKMYGRYVLVDEVNKLVSDALNKLIEEEQLHILGEPLPNESQPMIDFDSQTEFTFLFDLGLAPKMDLSNMKEIAVNAYKIVPDSKMLEDYMSHYTRRYGAFVSLETVEAGNEMVRGDFFQTDEAGNDLETGITAEDTAIYLEFLKEEEIKNQFVGLKAGDGLLFDVKKAFPNDTEIASMLRLKKEEVASMEPSTFRFVIRSVSRFANAEINQELFDKIYGEGIVTTKEAFEQRVREEISANLEADSAMKLRMEVRRLFVSRFVNELPAAFLKRWLLRINEGKFSAEEIEKDFDVFEKDLKWQLIRNQIVKDFEINLTDDDLLAFAKKDVAHQFAQYGMRNMPDEQLTSYAQGMLGRKEESRRVVDKMMDESVFNVLRNQITVNEVEVTAEAFEQIMSEEQQA